MKLEELVKLINQSCDNVDYISARKYIEANLELLYKHKLLLNSNAREIVLFLKEQEEAGKKPLTRQELGIIQTINQYAYNFNLRGIKIVLRENPKVFLKEETLPYLNSDAKTILTGMGVIQS